MAPVTGGAGAVDAKNLFVCVGGMGNLPGLPAGVTGYDGSFGKNGAGVLTGVTGPLGGVGGGVGSNTLIAGVEGADAISFGGFTCGGTPYGGGGAGAATP